MFNHNIYVGCENGLFKGVNTLKGEFQNLNLSKDLKDKNKEIVSMCWLNEETQDEVKIIRLSKEKNLNLIPLFRSITPRKIILFIPINVHQMTYQLKI